MDTISFEGKSVADFGCSNGYLTSLISNRYHPAEIWGFDSIDAYVALARARYPKISFTRFDLNRRQQICRQFDIVTCFEVLEHVGALENALDNLVKFTVNGGVAIITVPIEIGLVGLSKFLLKTIVFGDSLSELRRRKFVYLHYFMALLFGRSIARFREPKDLWGTHFGFDFTEIDSYLRAAGIAYSVVNRLTSRLYLLRPSLRADVGSPMPADQMSHVEHAYSE